MNSNFNSDPKPLGKTVLSRETIVAALKTGPTDFINRKHISCNVDLSPLVKEEELNYLRLRYNEYILQYTAGPVNLEHLKENLGKRQEEAGAAELELQALRDEMIKADEERRNSADFLTLEAQEHHLQVARLEQELQALREEIKRLQEGDGAGTRKQMSIELDCAIQELEHLECDIDQRLQDIESLESQAAEKDKLLANTRSELESILSILDQIESKCANKMNSMKEAITVKESQLSELHLQIEALNTCMKKLKIDLDSCQNEAELLKNSVMEKNVTIENYMNDNHEEIVIELGDLRDGELNGNPAQRLEGDRNQIQDRLVELEEQLEESRRADENAKRVNKNMAAEIESALKILDVSTVRVEELIHENETLKFSIAGLEEQNQAKSGMTQQERAAVRRVFKDELDLIVDSMKKKNSSGSHSNSSSKSDILSELEAADQTLLEVENMLLNRGTAAEADAPAWRRLGSLFVRYYPLLLTIIFFVLVIRVNIFCMGSWNLWLPYFLFSALSFTLPHPFGAIASLLAAFVVAASFFV